MFYTVYGLLIPPAHASSIYACSRRCLKACFPQFYLAALSHIEVPELVDSHVSIAVSYQDTVRLRGKQQGLHLHTWGSTLHDDWVQAEGEERCLLRETDRVRMSEIDHNQQTDLRLSLTHMLESRSQISSCPSLTHPNTVAHFGDHLMSDTALWLEVKPSTGLR